LLSSNPSRKSGEPLPTFPRPSRRYRRHVLGANRTVRKLPHSKNWPVFDEVLPKSDRFWFVGALLRSPDRAFAPSLVKFSSYRPCLMHFVNRLLMKQCENWLSNKQRHGAANACSGPLRSYPGGPFRLRALRQPFSTLDEVGDEPSNTAGSHPQAMGKKPK
jgi:hypothetical protein